MSIRSTASCQRGPRQHKSFTLLRKLTAMHMPAKRTGFTIVELLTVIGIISILIGLLLPAIQSARESARKMDCMNRLRQIGVATHHFESAYRAFPGNGWGYRWRADPNRGIGPQQPGGWIFQIAGFCEMPLPASTAIDPIASLHTRTELTRLPFPLMRCPSRPGSELSLASVASTPYNATFVALVAKTDYAANEGSYITDTDGGPRSLAEGDRRSYHWTNTDAANGVIYLRSRVRTASITGGLSQTYLAGEKHVSSANYFDSQDPGHDQSLFSGVDLDLNRWTSEPPQRDSRDQHTRAFGSAHPSGCNMLLCDGAVATVDYSIAPAVHREQGTRQ
ncbi:DUF1559 family PulG-like putative transporter [Aureliella helgolandensis]|uniref:DUF1559 domain-containing protein n=1 Tax=Aureliella helgolandensis TaxID=2527968 RepID=A0A518GCA8_9BACT|nr:DUF1559 domain-containing protein [Aureliella helgolandensis]QDV26231.1 hypothetical protein Q31a_46030 [Aureliella helgolandensis]